jgi:1-deoxy-D-xylulose-5-phosphate synthase
MIDSIKKTTDVRDLSNAQLVELASEVRKFLISSVSKTGGHIGANLGVIELTIALHHCFDLDYDKVLFDVGHQGYTHKLLTGRKKLFSTLNEIGGMSRFLTSHESDYDLLDASHAGTSISIAVGLAFANKEKPHKDRVVAVIGDGSLVEGMAFEGLNYAAENILPLIIVINDNGMSIPPNLGAIHKIFSNENWQDKSRSWFESMGFIYEPVSDGHDLEQLLKAFESAKRMVLSKPVIVHVKTQKGRGLELAKNHPYKLHFSMPFDPETGDGISAAPQNGETYQGVVGDVLELLMTESNDVYAITPATPYASGVESIMKQFPNRAIDVGMAEQHAVGMSVGLAMQGKIVFTCFQSTFMQRAMDQLFHDVCYRKWPITIVSARSGFAGHDGPTHHGIYDFGYMRALPHIKIFYAGSKRDLIDILKYRSVDPIGPLIVLHPYEMIAENEEEYLPAEKTPLELPEKIEPGNDGIIVTMGNRIKDALVLRNELNAAKNLDFGVVNIRWLKPLPEAALIEILSDVDKVITLEESVKEGGMGSAITQFINEKNLKCDVLVSAIENGFLPAGDKEYLNKLAKIDVKSIMTKVEKRWE